MNLAKVAKNIDFADKTAVTNASGFTLRHKKKEYRCTPILLTLNLIL